MNHSLVYSVPYPYKKLMEDDRSWNQLWRDYFGKRGGTQTEYWLLNIRPCEQPNKMLWAIEDNYDMKHMEIDKTINLHKVLNATKIDNEFKKIKTKKAK